MGKQLSRRLSIADEIVIDEIEPSRRFAFKQLVELCRYLRGRFQARVATVEIGDVAKFAHVRTAAGELYADQEITFEFR